MIKEIILMRHGQPLLADSGKRSPKSMQRWIEEYEAAQIIDEPAPAASVQLAARAKVIVSSTAPRALTSAKALGLVPDSSDALFREAQLPSGRWGLPRLSPFTWAAILRLRWLCGFSGNVESVGLASQRARQGALRLESLTDAGPVLLLGHGVMNRLIARHLAANGWTRHSNTGSRYWSASVYRKPDGR